MGGCGGGTRVRRRAGEQCPPVSHEPPIPHRNPCTQAFTASVSINYWSIVDDADVARKLVEDLFVHKYNGRPKTGTEITNPFQKKWHAQGPIASPPPSLPAHRASAPLPVR